MGRKRHSPEEITGKLREPEVLIARGQTTPQAARATGLRSRPISGGAGSTAA